MPKKWRTGEDGRVVRARLLRCALLEFGDERVLAVADVRDLVARREHERLKAIADLRGENAGETCLASGRSARGEARRGDGRGSEDGGDERGEHCCRWVEVLRGLLRSAEGSGMKKRGRAVAVLIQDALRR